MRLPQGHDNTAAGWRKWRAIRVLNNLVDFKPLMFICILYVAVIHHHHHHHRHVQRALT